MLLMISQIAVEIMRCRALSLVAIRQNSIQHSLQEITRKSGITIKVQWVRRIQSQLRNGL